MERGRPAAKKFLQKQTEAVRLAANPPKGTGGHWPEEIALKKIVCLQIGLLLWLLAPAASPAASGVSAGAGKLFLNGEFQVVWDWTQEDQGNGQPRVESIDLRHPRLALTGDLGRFAGFYFRTEILAGDTSGPTPPTTLLDARVDLKPLPWLTVAVGRFAPAWTLYAPADIHDLDTLRFPIMVDPGLSTFNPGRQTGIQANLHFGGNVDLHLGVFNGLDQPDNFSDNDYKKDLLVSVEARLLEQMRVLVGYYIGDLHVNDLSLAPGESVTLPFGQTITNPTNHTLTINGFDLHHESFDFGLSGNLARDRIRVRAEYLHHTASRANTTQVESLGYLLHFGIKPLSRLETLVRYEYWDPATGTANNELIWTTAGLNLALNDHSRLSLDYIFKRETGTNVSQGGNKSHNDEFLAGITVWW